MSSPTDPAKPPPASSTPAELRRDIEEDRGELGDTVEALADKADVKGRVQDKAQELKAQATGKAQELKAQASEKAQEVRDQVSAKAPQLTEAAQQKAQQAQRVVKDKPGPVAGAALAVLGFFMLRRRRRRRQKRS